MTGRLPMLPDLASDSYGNGPNIILNAIGK